MRRHEVVVLVNAAAVVVLVAVILMVSPLPGWVCSIAITTMVVGWMVRVRDVWRRAHKPDWPEHR